MSQRPKKRKFFNRKSRQNKSNYAFIDAQNLNLGTQKVGWKMDWKKFRIWLRDRYKVEKAYMFIGYVPNNESLYKQMQEAGYVVVLKPTVDMLMTEEELKDDKHVTKGNADAELVLYAVKEIQNYNNAVVVSGDGDFFCLVEYLMQQNKLAKLITPNDNYSSLYKPFESNIEVIDRFRPQLSYASVRRRKAPSRKPRQKR